MDWRIGCSGFYYKEWKEIFYPTGLAQKNWFEYYAQHFNTIEINSTFYKMPGPKTFSNWMEKSPDDFLFTIKAPRLITHYKKFNEVESLLADFYGHIREGLQEKLGAVLFQMPPSFVYTEERLSMLLQHLDPAFQNVIEFRHISWWTEEVFHRLTAQHITFSGQSYPAALPDERIENTDTIYYRFHGKPVLYKSLYEQAVLENFVKEVDTDKKQVYVYFNNTWGQSALINARQMQDLTKML
jgi:uncharacterized protein YecE (DUF72 family)